MCGLLRPHNLEEPSMQTITTVGLDIAKSVFQVHGADSAGQVVIRRQLKRRYVLAFFQKLPPCLVGIEPCASSHQCSRELKALAGENLSWGYDPIVGSLANRGYEVSDQTVGNI